VFFPAGVAGPEKRVGYVADGSAGIEALDLSTGESIWRSDAAARPAIVAEHRLLAVHPVPDVANGLRVVVLDRNDRGKLLLESEPIRFPEWVSVQGAISDDFRYEARIEGTRLLLDWDAQARYRGGAAPPPSVQSQATKAAHGRVSVDVETGAVEMRPIERPGAPELPSALEQADLFSYQIGASDTWQTRPWLVNGRVAVITGEVSDGGQVLRLQRWNPSSGRVDPPVHLLDGEALVSYVTPDGCYLLVHRELPTESAPNVRDTWWLFSVVTGERVAVLEHEPGAREACVLGTRLHYLTELPPPPLRGGGELVESTVKTVDIGSGTLLWQHPLSPRRTRSRPALRQ